MSIVAFLVAGASRPPATSANSPERHRADLHTSVLSSFQKSVPFSAQTERERARLTRKLQAALDCWIPGHSRVAIEIDWDLRANYLNRSCDEKWVSSLPRPCDHRRDDVVGYVYPKPYYPVVAKQIRVSVFVTDAVDSQQLDALAKVCHQTVGLRTERGDSISIIAAPL